jgi:hypothetical protein
MLLINGSLRFVPASAPQTDVEVARLLVSVRRRIVRLVRRHGIELDGALEDEQASEPLALDNPSLAPDTPIFRLLFQLDSGSRPILRMLVGG